MVFIGFQNAEGWSYEAQDRSPLGCTPGPEAIEGGRVIPSHLRRVASQDEGRGCDKDFTFLYKNSVLGVLGVTSCLLLTMVMGNLLLQKTPKLKKNKGYLAIPVSLSIYLLLCQQKRTKLSNPVVKHTFVFSKGYY